MKSEFIGFAVIFVTDNGPKRYILLSIESSFD